MVVGVFPKLSETFILNQITGLLDLGHDVRIISFGRPSEEVVHPDVASYDLPARTSYVDMPSTRQELLRNAPLCFANLLARHLGSCVSAARIMQRRLGLPRPYEVVQAERVATLLAGCDVVHCHFGHNANRALPAARLVGAPLVVTFHGADLRECAATSGVAFRALFRHVDRVLAISQYSARVLSENGLAESKIIIHRVGVNTEGFPFISPRSDTRSGILILTVARLVEEKGLDLALRTIYVVVRSVPSVQLRYTIVGGGPLYAELVRLRDELGLQQAVTFAGPSDSSTVRRWLRDADLFLLTSRDEVTPVVLMEAQASGRPVVAADVGAVAEVVRDGVTGFVVPERDPNALAERLRYLIDNPQLWPRMGRAGRAFVEENFDMRKLNERLVGIYEDVIAGRPVGGTPPSAPEDPPESPSGPRLQREDT